MDHFDIVKRAWRITWKYKVLWILGLFVGAGGGGTFGRGFNGDFGNNNVNSTPGSSGNVPAFPGLQNLGQQLQANIGLVVLAAAGLFMLVLALWIVSIAARGGLAYLVNEAAENRPVRARSGWGFGFRMWGRTFLIGFVLGLPVFVLAMIIGIVVALAIAGARAGGGVAASGIVGACGVIGLAFVILIPLAIVIGVLYELALRHGVLDGMTTGGAISAAWWDLRHRFADVAVMWVILLALGIGFGIALAIVAFALFLPAIGLIAFGAWAPAALLFFVAFVVLLLPSAVFSTLISSSWTLFFRRLTGRDVPAALPVHAAPAGSMPTPPAGAYPSPAPGGHAPPAPPMPPVPMPPQQPVPGAMPPTPPPS